MTHALIQSVLSQNGETSAVPSVRPILTDAVTPKGELCLIGENAQPRVFRLLAHWGMDMTPILREISLAARMAGYDVEEHLCPTVPDRLLHLTIPALGTLITSRDILPSEQTFDFPTPGPPLRMSFRLRCASSSRWSKQEIKPSGPIAPGKSVLFNPIPPFLRHQSG